MKKAELIVAINRMIAAQKSLYGDDAYMYATSNLQGALQGCTEALSDFMVEGLIETFNNRAKEVEQQAIMKAINQKVEI